MDDKDKKNEKVDIQTPFANLKVDSSDKPSDNGIPVYPGAKLRPADKDGDNHSANINMGAFGFGLKVIAAEYETDDSPEKVKAFYEDKMKSFGTVLVCNGHSSGGSDTHVYHLSAHKDDGDNDKKLNCSDPPAMAGRSRPVPTRTSTWCRSSRTDRARALGLYSFAPTARTGTRTRCKFRDSIGTLVVPI